MEITKEQRNKYYKKVLKDIESDKFLFICPVLGHIANIDPFNIITFFPELLAKKPAERPVNDVWWPSSTEGKLNRMRVLKECIKETNP